MFNNYAKYNDLVFSIYTQILPQNNNVTTFVSFGTGCIFCMTCYFWHFSTITSVQHLKLKLSYQNSHRGENFAWRGRNVYVLLTIHETHQGKPINSCNNKTLFMKNREFNNINSTIILWRTNWLNSPAAWKGFLDLSILSQKPCYVANARCHPYFHVLDKSIKMITRFNIVFEYILNIDKKNN